MKNLNDYSDAEHDRAMARLMADLGRVPSPPKAQPQATGGVCACLIVLLFMLGLAVLFMAGCNTVAGVAADVEAAARGTQDYLAEPTPGYTGR